MSLSCGAVSGFGSVLFDDIDVELGQGRTFLFGSPERVIEARSSDEVGGALREIDEEQGRGRYVAGYISYDAAAVLDAGFVSRHGTGVPLVWLGVYDGAREIDYRDAAIDDWDGGSTVGEVRLNVPEDEYLGSVERVKGYISSGDVYQVNYADKLLFENMGTPASLFARLRGSHPVCHSAFIDMDDMQVLSISPELFLRRTGRIIKSRPMKGTMPRGRTPDEDEKNADFLRRDEKSRAENVMIVDVMRNDLGRVCEYGAVSVPELFRVERYRSVLQMTSEVTGVLKDDVTSSDILKATLPPASVTGAPKIRAVEIIDELERESRGIYCGCIGLFAPDGDFVLSVAIRTIVQRGSRCEMGVGGGIVADSTAEGELREAMLKGEFVRA